jgi:hypothetical protein
MPKAIRPIRIEGNIAYVSLTKGYVATVDASDVEKVRHWNWSALMSRNTIYARRAQYFNGKPRVILMHRAILDCQSGLEVDHIDGNGLNNCRNNLRLASPSENRRNQRKRSDNSSGFKGVSWYPQRGKWRALIGINGKIKHLGYFLTAEEAHQAYCLASAEIHREFGRAN